MFKKKIKILVHPAQLHRRPKLTVRLRHAAPEIFGFLLVVLFAWAFLQSTRLVAIALELRQKILVGLLGGVKTLQEIKNEQLNQQSTLDRLELALTNFRQSSAELKAFEDNLFGFSKLLPQTRTANNFLEGSMRLAEAGKSSVRFLRLLENLSFGPQGLSSNQVSFFELSSELKNFEAQLKSAQQNIRAINPRFLNPEQTSQLLEMQNRLNKILQSTATLRQLISLGEYLTTGQKNILMLLQNQNELRPTGGFLGSYGFLILKQGAITNLTLSSVYDLDGQLTEKIQPPFPLLAVNNRWFLRDANWFSDFPLSTKKIISFFEKEGGETPDIVVAVTAKAVSALLNITGPLKTEDGKELNAETFLEVLQVLTQGSPDDPLNQPKKILSELFLKLFGKLGQLTNAEKIKTAESLLASLQSKQILIFSRENYIQDIVEKFNWAGALANSDRDYLLVTGANLGGTKTDEYIDQKITLKSIVRPDGQIENILTIKRTNTLPKMPGAENKSFVRIYVPLKSRLIENTGFDRVDLKTPAEIAPEFRIDRDVLRWERFISQDIVTGTFTGEESGKTFFGNWIITPPQESKTVTLRYLLPFKLKTADRHSLLVQKQPGSGEINFEYIFQPAQRRVEWSSFRPDIDPDTRTLTVSTPLNNDVFFGMVLWKEK